MCFSCSDNLVMAERLQWALPSQATLLSIAQRVCTSFQCSSLAIRLGLGYGIVDLLQAEGKNPQEVALGLLQRWLNIQGNSASGRDLYRTLERIEDLRDVARTFHDELHIPGGGK